MANLDKVPPKSALIVVTWPKVKKGLGFPVRAFAILPQRISGEPASVLARPMSDAASAPPRLRAPRQGVGDRL